MYMNIPPEFRWGTAQVQFSSVIEEHVNKYLSTKSLPPLQSEECIRFWKLSSSSALHNLSAEQKRPGEVVYMCKWSPYLPDPRHASFSHLLAQYDDDAPPFHHPAKPSILVTYFRGLLQTVIVDGLRLDASFAVHAAGAREAHHQTYPGLCLRHDLSATRVIKQARENSS